jgi:deazaflavin-dependent oxidoreductase (nitroreductase family)
VGVLERLSTALSARILRTRWLVRSPLLVYRFGLGALLGSRVLLLEHVGRRSGRRRQVVLETVLRPAQEEIVVASGFGAASDWYRNVQVNPDVRVSCGRVRCRQARAELLDGTESRELLAEYAARHPTAFRRLMGAIAATSPDRLPDVRLVRLRLA